MESSQTLPLSNIAAIYKTLGEPGRAIEYYNQALAVARKYKQQNSEHAVLINLAVAYSESGDHQRGLDTQLLALPYWKAAKDRQGEVLCLGYVADDYFGCTIIKMPSYYQQLGLSQQTNSIDGMGRAFFGLGKTYNRLGDAAQLSRI